MKLNQNFFLKFLAFLLALIFFGVAGAMTIYQTVNFNVLWEGDYPFYGYTNQQLLWQAKLDIEELLHRYQLENLDLYAQRRIEELEEKYSSKNTNLRWIVQREGEVVYGNGPTKVPAKTDFAVYSVEVEEKHYSVEHHYCSWYDLTGEEAVELRAEDWQKKLQNDALSYQMGNTSVDPNRVYAAVQGSTSLLVVKSTDGTHIFAPTVKSVLEPNEYGYLFEPNTGWVQHVNLIKDGQLFLWLDPTMRVYDDFKEAYVPLVAWQAHRWEALAATAVSAVLAILCTVYLCVTCGHKKGKEGIYLNWFHRITGDLLLAAWILGFVGLCVGFSEVFSFYGWEFRWSLAAGTACIVGIAFLVISFLVTFVARCKGRALLRYTVIGWICIRLWRLCRRIAAALPLVWKTVLAGVAYLILSLIFVHAGIMNMLPFWIFVWIMLTVAAIAYLSWWAFHWKKVRVGTHEIISGNTNYHIERYPMPLDLQAHADELNRLGHAIGAAVEERLKSEHFKAELITNVSHDLKTPLTSIISYVDLLKKEEIDNPKVQEYIEVLDRKSQRLKKLTEDLVEASKASTGALTVSAERLDLVQLTRQALGEYEERLTAHGLSVVSNLPAQPVWVMADGRHLWRIMDNLLSNCAKYALEGTRVYVEVQGGSDCVRLSVKNISREVLNLSADRLTERFVRGDESRTMEGSGLGLSIAQSLAELQKGEFHVEMDGDLFKAVVTLPLAPETQLL